MTELVFILILFVVWLVLQVWILPGLGFST